MEILESKVLKKWGWRFQKYRKGEHVEMFVMMEITRLVVMVIMMEMIMVITMVMVFVMII